MTDDTTDELPGNWESGAGAGNRPLSEGGYYLHHFYRVLPGSNQHVERFLELRVDTVGATPTKHACELSYCVETDVEVKRVKRLDYGSIRVSDPNSDEAQSEAEEAIHAIAEDQMADHADWEP